MQKYSNLACLFQYYGLCLEIGRTRDSMLAGLQECIVKGTINILASKKEFEQALMDPEFHWVKFAYKNEFIQNREHYSPHNIIQFFRFLASETLYPEITRPFDEIMQMAHVAVDLLKKHQQTEKGKGWMLLDDLHQLITLLDDYTDWGFYYMYYIFPNCRNCLSIKYEFGKRKRVIYLRYIP